MRHKANLQIFHQIRTNQQKWCRNVQWYQKATCCSLAHLVKAEFLQWGFNKLRVNITAHMSFCGSEHIWKYWETGSKLTANVEGAVAEATGATRNWCFSEFPIGCWQCLENLCCPDKWRNVSWTRSFYTIICSHWTNLTDGWSRLTLNQAKNAVVCPHAEAEF